MFPPSSSTPALFRRRWWILALLTLATTINYMDRIVFAVLVPDIRRELQLTDQQYGLVTGAFQAAYTVGFLIMGKVVDVLGSRIGYALAIGWWSLAAMLHVVSRSAFHLSIWRAMLGLGEAGNFPAAIKSVAEWFAPKDRAFATGVFNGGTNLASILGPPLFFVISMRYGWRACFLLTGGLGLIWLFVWLGTHGPTPQAAISVARIPWSEAIRMPGTWGFAWAKFFSDPVWWFYLYWLPLYLHDVRGLNMKSVSWALPVIYIMADLGSIAGGWLSGMLIRRGFPPQRARKATMLLCASLMPIAALGVVVPDVRVTIALFSLATAAHQGWSANLFTTVSDAFAPQAVGSVVGFGGFAGGIAGVLFSAVIPGYVIPVLGYTPVFLSMGIFYFIGLAGMHRLTRRKPALVRA